LLKVACSGPGVSRTCNLLVTSLIHYHYTTAPSCLPPRVVVVADLVVILLVFLHKTDHVILSKLDPTRSGHNVALEALERW